MNITEIIAVVFSLICVILTIKRNILCWPTGLVAVAAYAIVFFDVKLYADLGLQAVFFFQGIYGWWYWKKADEGNPPPITKLTPMDWRIYAQWFVLVYFAVVMALKIFTDSNVIFVDTFVATGSLIANLMLAHKKLESWKLWIIVDVVYVCLFLYKGLYMSSVLYLIFLGMAINGLISWKKAYEKI